MKFVTFVALPYSSRGAVYSATMFSIGVSAWR